MRFLIIFILILTTEVLIADHHHLEQEIDSLKKIVLSDENHDTREYHSTVIELYRKYRFNNPDSATFYLNYGISISENYKLDLITRDYYNMKGLFYFDKSNFSNALENFYKCLELSIKTNEMGAVGYTYGDIGYIFYVQGLWDLALQHYLEGIKVLTEADSTQTISMPLLYQNTGLTYGQLNEIDSALKYLNLALDFYKKENLQEKVYHTFLYIGHIYRRNLNEPENALEYYLKANEYFKKDKSWYEGYAYSLVHIGEAYLEIKDYNKALYYYDLAIKEMEDLGWQKKIIDVNFYKLLILLEIDDKEEIDSILKVNNDFIEKFESIDLLIDKYQFKYKYFNKYENSDSAYFYFVKFNELRDSLRLSSFTGQIATVLKDLQIVKDNKEKELIKEKNVQRIYLLMFILILAIFIIVLVYSRMRFQKKNVLILNEKNEELEKTNKLLDDANATKDKFFSIIAHDLKNPIGAVKSTSEMLYSDYEMFDSGEIKESIEDIFKSTASVQSLLDGLLTWSRSQRGKIEFNPEFFDIRQLTENIYQLLKNTLETKNIKLNIDIHTNLIVYADSNMINTVLRNLLGNAIKFTPENGEIWISAKKDDDNTIISVKDTGIGISKKDQKKLFNFGTNYSTLGTNNEKGTGLGLILVKEFIDKHNGSIKLESEKGKGTTIIITIPNAK